MKLHAEKPTERDNGKLFAQPGETDPIPTQCGRTASNVAVFLLADGSILSVEQVARRLYHAPNACATCHDNMRSIQLGRRRLY